MQETKRRKFYLHSKGEKLSVDFFYGRNLARSFGNISTNLTNMESSAMLAYQASFAENKTPKFTFEKFFTNQEMPIETLMKKIERGVSKKSDSECHDDSN